jgi:hypothetical protein
MAWLVRVQWVCTVTGSIKPFEHRCVRKPSQQAHVNPVNGDLSVHITEMDDERKREVWARYFAKVDWFEIAELPEVADGD